MRLIVSELVQLSVWPLFFLCTAYGHVGMKLAVGAAGVEKGGALLSALTNPWGLSALMSWFLSAILWAGILSVRPLFEASSVSALRYIVIALSAWIVFGEQVSVKAVIGMFVIALGIGLVVR